MATGRTGRTHDLGLEEIGLAAGAGDRGGRHPPGPGFDWLYAVGDVNGRALLTHQGKYQARAAGDVIAARAAGRPVDDAAVGCPRRDRRPPRGAAGHLHRPGGRLDRPDRRGGRGSRAAHRVLDYDLSWVAGASVHSDDYRGQARAIVDLDREVLVGATFAGPDVGELLQAATIAVVGEVPIDRLWHAVPAYPTLSEVWLRWLEAFGRPDAT